MRSAFGLFAISVVLGVLTILIAPARDLAGFQIVHQDMIVLIFATALLGFLMLRSPKLAFTVGADETRGFAFASAAFALIAGYAGAHVVALNFPLSVDEFMVMFDANIFRGGHLLAPVPSEWQGLTEALQPIFLFDKHSPIWGSQYLPVNAALHAAMSVLDSALTAPLLAAVSVLLLFSIARRIWPERPDAAFIAVLLLVTSSQFLMTAMTPYAMTAHLAFNLLWLWLFLRNTGASHGGAILVGFLATGLHQIVFHPLFAAPFILSLWLGRRFRLAGLYTVGYAAICLFWILWRSLVIADVPSGDGGGGISAFLANVSSLLHLNLAPVLYMPRNLMRLIAWNNPFTLVLFGMAFASLRRWAFPLPQLLAGIVLTLIFMLIVVPYQGHGWGYRYLHGLLGSISLIAAFAWIQITGSEAARMRGALAVCCIFALTILPLRAYQMRSFTEPYARASAAIANSDADIVIVDPSNIWYGVDLVRNDPYLRTKPKVMVLNRLEEEDLARLCAGNTIAIFDASTASRYGMLSINRKNPKDPMRRAFMKERGCGTVMGASS